MEKQQQERVGPRLNEYEVTLEATIKITYKATVKSQETIEGAHELVSMSAASALSDMHLKAKKDPKSPIYDVRIRDSQLVGIALKGRV